MKKRIIALLAVLIISMFTVPSFAQNSKAVEIYVSETGKDSATGSIDAPLKTVQAAVSLAEQYRSESYSVRIIFREGTYRLSEAVKLSSAISGTKDISTTFEAYEGEEVNFKASVPLDVSKAQAVTDPGISGRLYEHVRDKVIQIDLDAQGISQADILLAQNINGIYTLAGWEESWVEANSLYLNDNEQPLSRWPNDRHYARWVTPESAQSFVYAESAPSRWTKAKDFWLGGFPEYDYRYARSSVKEVDPVNKVITVIDNPVSPFTSYMTRRWAAFNLLEEIDMPGEFYIDRDSMMLYYYPPHVLDGQTLELSLLGYSMFDIRRAANVTFKNINFSQTRSNAIFMENVDNVDFIDCKFTNIDVNAIFCRGSQWAITSGSHWEHQHKDASYNVDVKGCDFYNIGMSAVDLSGGDVDTLKLSNNVIEDCFIQRTSQKSFWESISLRGCGVTVRNNNISFSPQQALRPWGSLHHIENNEFYDVLRENDDCGMIYWGGNSLLRGTMVQYNYFHDSKSIEEMVYKAKAAIYWDDGQSGMSAQGNIFANIDGRGLFSNGAGATLHRYNTSVNMDKEWHFSDHPKRETEIVTEDVFGTVAEAMRDIYDKELYFARWPALEALSRGINPKKFTEIYENLSVNSGEGFIGVQEQKFSMFRDNMSLRNTEDVDYNDIFVDPENQDFRLKKDSDIAKAMPNVLNEENFDIEKIGMTRNMTFDEEISPFRMLLPENGTASVSSSAAAFAWEHAFGANHYRLIVAKDPELKDVVYDDIVRYTCTTLDCLEKGTTYYWTVYAINNSREFSSTWQSSGKIHAFATDVAEKLDIYDAENVIKKVKDRLVLTQEGDNAGDYMVGTVDKANLYINMLKFLMNKRPVALTQAKLDNMASFLSQILDGEGMVTPGYLNLADRLEPEHWSGKVKVDGNSVVLAPEVTANTFGGSSTFEYMTGNIVYCFDAEFENSPDPGSWMTFGLSQRNDVHQYQATNPGYYICIKNNLVELQKTDNTGNKVIETKQMPLSNGKRRQVQMGRIKIGTGNVFFINIDGENLFTYYDVEGSELTASSQIAMCAYKEGERIALYPYSGDIPDQSAYEEMKKGELYNSIKPMYNMYSQELVNYAILNTGYAKVLNATGLYNVSSKPVVNNDDIYVTADTFEKMCNSKVSINGNSANITCDSGSAEVSVTYINNVPMFLVEEACIKLDKAYTYDWQNQNVFVADSGNFVVMNTLTKTKKTREMFEVMANEEDIIFNK